MPDVGTTHQVKIGGAFYQVMPGTYRKRMAPAFGARFSTGDPDYSNLTFWQHWVQSCWIGGFGAETWSDDSMFDEAVGVDGSQHEVLVLARDMGFPHASWALDSSTNKFQRAFFHWNDVLYCISFGTTGQSKLYKLNEGTLQWTLVHTFTEAITSFARFSGRCYFGQGTSNLVYMNSAESFSTLAKPAGRTEAPISMSQFRDRLYVAFDRFVWRLKTDHTWDGNTVFHEAVGVDRISTMESHLGFLYMGSNNGHILRTDGNATFDLWQWDGGTRVMAMRSYDGRLFVMCREEEFGTLAGAGVLYQFTGSAVTELKRWGLEGKHTYTNKMRVFFRKLYFGASALLGFGDGFGVATYDALEDAYHIFSSNRDGSTYPGGTNGVNWLVDDVFYWKGFVLAAVRGSGLYRTKLVYKDVSRAVATYDTTASGGSPGSKNGGWVQSSDFDAGTPGLVKYFRQAVVHVDLPDATTGVTFEWSGDGGATWTAVNLTKVVGKIRHRFAVAIRKKSTRLRYRVTLRTTNTLYSPQLRAVAVSYVPLPDPTWQWDMTLVLAQNLELLDGTTDTVVDPETEASTLEALARLNTPVTFKDIDGVSYDVAQGGVWIMDLQKDVPVRTADTDGPIESFVRVSLMECAEAIVEID